jgi:hypothetical protein
MTNSQLKMVGRQLEFDEEVREVTLGKHGNQNYLRLQLILIPIEFILQTEIQERSLGTSLGANIRITLIS